MCQQKEGKTREKVKKGKCKKSPLNLGDNYSWLIYIYIDNDLVTLHVPTHPGPEHTCLIAITVQTFSMVNKIKFILIKSTFKMIKLGLC